VPYVFRETQAGEPIPATDFPSLTSEVLTETFAQTFEENPVAAMVRSKQLADDYREGTRLDAATARQKLADRGMENDITVNDAGITQAALDTLMFRKGIEKRRQEVYGLAEGGFVQGAARLGVGLATSLVDPVGVATSFIPVVGETRYLSWLGRAGGVIGRTGVRAGVGAIEGAAGAALLEPIIAGSRRYEQADYDMADSLLNVAFGGVFGSGLHTTFGAVSDGINHYRDSESAIPRAALSGVDRVYETRLARKIDRNIDAAIAEYADVPGSEGGKILNTDLARELSPDYRADRTRSAAVHEPASYLVKQMYERRLAEAPKAGETADVIFSGGGTGAGKTTGLEAAMQSVPELRRAQIIYDTNLNGLKSSVQKIEQALAANRDVQIIYTYRDPVDALVNGALPRAKRMGRTVPIEEHAKTHVGSLDTLRELQQKYAGNDRVEISVFDNNYGKHGAKRTSVEALPRLEYNAVLGDLHAALEAQRAAGSVSQQIYAATKGKGGAPGESRANRAGSPRRAEPRDEGLSAEERLAAASPIQRETAVKQAVVDAITDEPINSAADAAELRSAVAHADTVLAREPHAGTPTADALKNATEEASLARSDLQALAGRLGEEAEDAELKTVLEAAANADRWAKAAELATVCLVRGG
jgi:hypothetical protein